MRLAAVPSVLALMMSGSVTFAAPATLDQAQTIKSALEKYVGNGGGGDASAVTVTPDGERYSVQIDVKKAFRGLEPMGVMFEPASWQTYLQPQEGGTWHVTNDGSTRFSVKFGERTVSLIINGTQFDGVFDPAIPSYTRSNSSFENMTLAALGENGETQTRETQKGNVVFGAEPVGDGVITGQLTQKSGGSVQQVTLEKPNGSPSAPSFNMKSGASVDESRVESLRVRSLLDVWAFFVAHPSAMAIKSDQEQLRSLLRVALPIFKHASQSASVEETTIESMVGAFEVESASIRLDLNGLVEDGRIGSEIKVASLKLPSGLVPPWAEGLVPMRVELAETLSGFHLQTLSQKAVDSFDLRGKDPFTPAALQELQLLFGSVDQMILTISPSHLAGALLDAKFEGQIHWKRPMPDIMMKVSVSGIDNAIKEVQSKGGQDEHAQQLIAVALLAKGLASRNRTVP